MVYPEIRDIHSPDLEPPTLPDDPAECAVRFRAVVGPRGGPEAEAYSFTVVTPARLARSADPVWGRGHLIIPVFDWALVIQAVALLLARCVRPTWDEVAAELNRELRWEVATGGAAGE